MNTPREGRPINALWAKFTFLAMGAVAPTMLIGTTPAGHGPWPALTYLFLGVAPLIQIRTGTFPETTPRMLTELMIASSVVVVVGIAAFAFGAKLYTGSPSAAAVREVHETRALCFALASLCASWWCVHAVGSVPCSRPGTSSLQPRPQRGPIR